MVRSTYDEKNPKGFTLTVSLCKGPDWVEELLQDIIVITKAMININTVYNMSRSRQTYMVDYLKLAAVYRLQETKMDLELFKRIVFGEKTGDKDCSVKSSQDSKEANG